MRFTRRAPAFLLAASVPAFAACEDAVTEPDGFVLAEEAEAVMRSAETLPTLPAIMEGAGPDVRDTRGPAGPVLARAHELWMEAAAENDFARAARQRGSAISLAAPHLAERISPAALDSIQGDLRDWINLAGGMLRHLSLPRVQEALNDAARLMARADVAEARDDHATAVWLTLIAGNRLVDTTPRVVARRMVVVVEHEFVRRRDDGAAARLDGEALLRSERMVNGARQALDEEDYVRAIQRAYYAGQLLELGPERGGGR